MQAPHNRRKIWRGDAHTACVTYWLLQWSYRVPYGATLTNGMQAPSVETSATGKFQAFFQIFFCALDQIFIRAIKPGRQHCCVWFFNKLGHAFVRGVKKRAHQRLLPITKSSGNIWQLTKPCFITFFLSPPRLRFPASLDVFKDLQVLKWNQKCRFFSIYQIKWFQQWHY